MDLRAYWRNDAAIYYTACGLWCGRMAWAMLLRVANTIDPNLIPKYNVTVFWPFSLLLGLATWMLTGEYFRRQLEWGWRRRLPVWVLALPPFAVLYALSGWAGIPGAFYAYSLETFISGASAVLLGSLLLFDRRTRRSLWLLSALALFLRPSVDFLMFALRTLSLYSLPGVWQIPPEWMTQLYSASAALLCLSFAAALFLSARGSVQGYDQGEHDE